MGRSMKESGEMESHMDKELRLGQMEESMMDSGEMGNQQGLVGRSTLMEKLKKVIGKKENSWKEVSLNKSYNFFIERPDGFLKALGEEKEEEDVQRNEVDDMYEPPSINLG